MCCFGFPAWVNIPCLSSFPTINILHIDRNVADNVSMLVKSVTIQRIRLEHRHLSLAHIVHFFWCIRFIFYVYPVKLYATRSILSFITNFITDFARAII